MHANATNRVSRGLTHAAQTPLRSPTPNYQVVPQALVAQTQLMCGALPQWPGQVYQYAPTSFQTPPLPDAPAMSGHSPMSPQSQLPPGAILAGPVIMAGAGCPPGAILAGLQSNPAYATYGIAPGGIPGYVNGPMSLTTSPHPTQGFWSHHPGLPQPILPAGYQPHQPAYCISPSHTHPTCASPGPLQKQDLGTQKQAEPAPAASRSNSNSPSGLKMTRSWSATSEPAPVDKPALRRAGEKKSWKGIVKSSSHKATPMRLNRLHTLNGQTNGQTPVQEQGRLNGQTPTREERRLNGQQTPSQKITWTADTNSRLYKIQEGGRLNRQKVTSHKFNSLRKSTPGRESRAHTKAGGEESLDYVMKQNRVNQVDIIRNQLDVCGNMLIRMQKPQEPISEVPSGPPPGLALPKLERDASNKSNSHLSPPGSPRTQKYGNVTPQLRQFYDANKGRANRNRRRRLNQRIRREREELARQQMFQTRMPNLSLNEATGNTNPNRSAPINPTCAVPLAFCQKKTPEARATAAVW